MKYFVWDEEKNGLLKDQRGVSFEEVVFYIEKGQLRDILAHPNSSKYPNQKVFAVEMNDYVYLVPYVENENEIFLKTIIPSRKATKKYLERG